MSEHDLEPKSVFGKEYIVKGRSEFRAGSGSEADLQDYCRPDNAADLEDIYRPGPASGRVSIQVGYSRTGEN
jgi:hypothetical protein